MDQNRQQPCDSWVLGNLEWTYNGSFNVNSLYLSKGPTFENWKQAEPFLLFSFLREELETNWARPAMTSHLLDLS